MTDWWSYRLEDFLLFSEEVYWRLFELHNNALWPAQLVALALGVVVLYFVLRPRPWSGRIIALILAIAWSFVAWSFLWRTYATINWAASYAAPFFAIEAVLLAWLGVALGNLSYGPKRRHGRYVRLALVIYALFLHPLVTIVAGRPIASAELFGLTPDPTAIATLGLIGLSAGGTTALALFLVPAVWCLISWATLYAMGTWEAWIPLAALVFSLSARPWRRIEATD